MSTRTKMLDAIGKNKPAFIPAPVLPEINSLSVRDEIVSAFISTLNSIGGQARVVNSYEDISNALDVRSDKTGYWINTVSALEEINAEITAFQNARDLESVYHACIQGSVGVAENGAICVDEKQMINRLLPFICQHLSLVLHIEDIVANMHQAYDRININKEGYGVFIAGPSKTADIEQSLVIGAHGARSLVVYIVDGTGK